MASANLCWELLPDNVLHEITGRLDTLSDYVRFGAVCKEWLSFAQRSYKQKHFLHPNQQLPLLLIPTRRQETRSLYSITTGLIYDQFELNLPFKRCCGSSFGWLFFVEKKAPWKLILLNPFLREFEPIKLPPIKFLPEDRVYKMDEYGIKKAILSKDPFVSPDDYEVVVLYGGLSKLAHYNCGDKFWSYSKDKKKQVFCDVIFYKGFICAVDRYSWIVRVTLENSETYHNNNNRSPRYLKLNTMSKRLRMLIWNYAGNAYLVESSKGDLLLVRRSYWHIKDYLAIVAAEEAAARQQGLEPEGDSEEEEDEEEQEEEEDEEEQEEEEEEEEEEEQEEEVEEIDSESDDSSIDEKVYDKPNLSVEFEVLMLSFRSARKTLLRRKKMRMKTLHGDTLLLGDNHSISVTASKYHGLHPNSIYYTDDYTGLYSLNIYFGSCDTGIFNVEDRSFHKHFVPSFSTKGMPPPVFVVPHYRIQER